ncbi:MAG: ribonuclease III [Nitrospirota bacterium]
MRSEPPVPDLSGLQEKIGYRFADPGLLLEALTHKSYQHENPEAEHNERLEFLGDAVLGLVVVDYLFGLKEQHPESVMSRIKSHMVRGSVLAWMARTVSLGEYLRLGRGEEDSGGREKRSILADAAEAVIGAVYLDGGLEAARDFTLRSLGERLEKAVASREYADYKTQLQEESQMRFGVLPEYRLQAVHGEEHRRVFTMEVLIAGVRYGTGKGTSKKEAETSAARRALEHLGGKERGKSP